LEGLRTYLTTVRGPTLHRQFCRKLLGYALGRRVQLSDGPLLDALQQRLTAPDARMQDVIEAIVRSPQFRQIRGRDADWSDSPESP
jgi:hypothetical protein